MTDILCQPWLWLPETLLVIVTIYYAYYASRQSKLLYNAARRDRLTKELELIIVPLETMMQDYIKKDSSSDRWYITHDLTRAWMSYSTKTDVEYKEYQKKYAEDKEYKDLVKNIQHNIYLCPKPDLCQRVDEFLMSLKDMERGARDENPTEFEMSLSKAINNLFGGEPREHVGVATIGGIPRVKGGAVAHRHSDILEELKRLESHWIARWIARCMSWIRRRYYQCRQRLRRFFFPLL